MTGLTDGNKMHTSIMKKKVISSDTLPLTDFSKRDTWVTVSSDVSDSSSSKVSRIGSCEGGDKRSINACYAFCIKANADVVNVKHRW